VTRNSSKPIIFFGRVHILRAAALSLVIIFEAHYIVFTQIVAELYFDERERLSGRVSEAVVRSRRDVYVLALPET
jgi:hypothetical protein